MYRSGAEAEFAAWLKNNKVKFKYEPFKLKYPVVYFRRYLPDFVLKDDKMVIEFKGWFTAGDRKKLIAVRKEYPDLDIRIVFEKDNWMTKKHKDRYSDWAKKNGFKYHIGISLPEEWMRELK